MPRRFTMFLIIVSVTLLGSTPVSLQGANPPNATTQHPFTAPLAETPLAKPLVFNGGFGDYRIGHFHAGFDLGTGRKVGRPVFAPDRGWIERVRSSGIGYGRSIYLRTSDGRTLQLGHLDAFAGALAGYVQHVQDSTGQYEQDLWPSPGQFPVRAGEIIAWSGESGAGGPHLHFEIRREDVAYHPLRAGLVVQDNVPPTLAALILEPLDDSSLAAGGSGPFPVALSGRDTVSAIGRLRAIVRASDRLPNGTEDTVPWSVGIEWDGRRTECRFDSISWATDMPEEEYVYDSGRVTGGKGLVLWSPRGFRPRVLRADAPASEEAGTITIRQGDPPRALEVWARDLGGGVAVRRVVLRPGAAPPREFPGWWRGKETWSGTSVSFASLPGGFVRLTVPAASSKDGPDLQLGAEARHATRAPGGWSATFSVPESAAARTVRLPLALRGPASATAHSARGGLVWARRERSGTKFELADATGMLRVGFAPGALFEDATVVAYACPRSGASGLIAVGDSWQVEPSRHPLRVPARVSIAAPSGTSRDRIGLYRLDSGGWQWIGADRDSAPGAVAGNSWRLGRFALFRDVVAPRVTLIKPPARTARARPYSRWAVEASVVEDGSGIDARSSWFEVDGRRVPTEWDPEAGRLRWRPARPPERGEHALLIVATDRSGNETRTRRSF
ncbi:MAG TPA: M23 family metallopeptidase [Candidatus Dormibacteraeota bacterium]|nr:M23 family metallopeptidase [Candidatus Dormibacteraeota bacterium]